MNATLALEMPKYREWFYRTADESDIAAGFLDRHHDAGILLSEVLDAICQPSEDVYHKAPWAGRDATREVETLQGRFVIAWSSRHGYAAVYEIV